jgi:hypothetical protein
VAGRRRRPSGRSPSLNADRVTRMASRILAEQGSGAGHWKRTHQEKTTFPLFCAALRQEKGHFGGGTLPGDSDRRRQRREIYGCRYGGHYLIESAPVHWHVGRASASL